MLQTLNCIRMGEVLFDENLQLFILCNNCHSDLRNTQDFRQHLEKCEGLENLFQEGHQIKYNTDKSTQLFGKTLKGIKEFLVYDYNDIEVTYPRPEDNFIDLINIEEELLNPKWYSDINTEVSNISAQKSSKQYDELVEEVTPFVQFKENLKNNNNNSKSDKSNLIKTSAESIKKQDKTLKNGQVELTTNKTKAPVKRKLSVSKPVSTHFEAPSGPTQINTTTLPNLTPITRDKANVNKKRKTESIPNGFAKLTKINQASNSTPPGFEPKMNNMLPLPSTTTSIISTNTNVLPSKFMTTPTTFINSEPTKEKQTAQILNKLQNLGLQVKRTQPLPPPVVINSPAPNKTDTKTLEILQKLQSKGMKVKILNKQQTTEINSNVEIAKPLPGLSTIPLQKPTSIIRNSSANMAIKQTLNKNLIIRKVN